MALTIIAGVVSTLLFTISHIPMLMKAVRTRDMASYSIGNLALSNVANAVHSIYVFSLPIGPIWALHSFYLITAAVMLIWFLRFDTHRREMPTHPESTEDLSGDHVRPEPAHSLLFRRRRKAAVTWLR